MNHKEKSCQTSPEYNVGLDKDDILIHKYPFVQREQCTHGRARWLLHRELTKDTSESTNYVNSSNLADNKLSCDARNNHDVCNTGDLFAANRAKRLQQSDMNFFQATDGSIVIVKNHGDSEPKPTVSTFNNNEQFINHLAMPSEGDRNAFTPYWMKSISEKNCHEACKIQSLYSSQNKDSWTPKTVWVNKTCKPVIIPIKLSHVHNTNDQNQQPLPQNCDSSVSKSHIRTSRSMETDEKNKNWQMSVDGKYNLTFNNQIKSPIKEQVIEKCLSSVEQDQNSVNNTNYSLSAPMPNLTVHLNTLSHQETDSFEDVRINSFSSQDPNNRLFACNSEESSKANKRCNTPSLASISSIIQIVNRSIQNVINHSNDIEESSSTPDTITEQAGTENPKFMEISLPHPPRTPVPRDSGGRYTHISTVTTSGDTSRTRPSVTISQNFSLPVRSTACPKSPSIASDVTISTFPSSLSQRISIKRFEDTTEAKVKRPMNAFMVWAKEHRPILANVFNGLTNSQISIKLGDMWNSLPKAQKQKYYDQAEVIKRQHKRDFPGWVYQPRPAKKRRESKYSLTNLFPSEEAMKEHMMSMSSYNSLSSFRAMNNSEKPSNTTSRNNDSLLNEITDEHKVSNVKSQKFVLEPIQVNPDNPKEFTCMMKPIEQSTANQTPQLVHVMPILKTSSEELPTADGNQLTRLDKLTTGTDSVDTSRVMWSPMKANCGNKHQNRLRYPIRRLHMDFNRREISSDTEDDDDLDYEKIHKYCLQSGIPLEEVHMNERTNSETSVELDRIFRNIANGNDEDNFDGCSTEWLSAPEIEILTLEKQTSD